MTGIEKLQADPRVTVRRQGAPGSEGRCVVYWMQRSQRGLDNPALDVAINAANELGKPVAVFFGLHPKYPNANLRHYAFLVEGLAETKRRVEERGAAFVFRPYPNHDLIGFCEESGACLVIGDENPMREPERWRRSATQKLRVPFWTVDADVIAPTKFFPKDEFAARTLRPKLHRLLPAFFQPLENPSATVRWDKQNLPASQPVDVARVLADLPLDRSAQPVGHFKGGTTAGLSLLNRFIAERLEHYDTARNQPHLAGTSELSAYLHFGQLGPHTIALAVRDADAPQIWTRAPDEAFDIAVRLNDHYELDGRDPNGYTGIAWAIGGKHDRPWGPARPVFGMIRYMNANGCARKFDVKAYIQRVETLVGRKASTTSQAKLF